MGIVQEVREPEVTETVTAADFSYPEHAPQWTPSGVCAVCGKIGGPVSEPAGNFQDPFPRFGADEYLNW